MKLVSVVVLAYRSADTIIETLESIKKQTYPKIELIVTDDCSPDNTVEVVKNWMRDNKGCLSDMKLVTAEKYRISVPCRESRTGNPVLFSPGGARGYHLRAFYGTGTESCLSDSGGTLS